jgi:hypothetical protein
MGEMKVRDCRARPPGADSLAMTQIGIQFVEIASRPAGGLAMTTREQGKNPSL